MSQNHSTFLKIVTAVSNMLCKCFFVPFQGISSKLRADVWKYLLGYLPWEATTAEQIEIRNSKEKEYNRMKLQWQMVTPAQEARFSDFRDRKSLIGKFFCLFSIIFCSMHVLTLHILKLRNLGWMPFFFYHNYPWKKG